MDRKALTSRSFMLGLLLGLVVLGLGIWLVVDRTFNTQRTFDYLDLKDMCEDYNVDLGVLDDHSSDVELCRSTSVCPEPFNACCDLVLDDKINFEGKKAVLFNGCCTKFSDDKLQKFEEKGVCKLTKTPAEYQDEMASS